MMDYALNVTQVTKIGLHDIKKTGVILNIKIYQLVKKKLRSKRSFKLVLYMLLRAFDIKKTDLSYKTDFIHRNALSREYEL